MTKEEKIKEAWGENWSKISKENQKKVLNNNGFVSQYYEDLLSKETTCRKLFDVRPKSLQGIENNNGWIKIESEEDLPKDYEISYHAWNSESDRDYYVTNMWTIINRYHLGNVTHYQPIEKPLKPIY